MFIVSLFAKLWKDEKKPVHNFTITKPCLKTFSDKYDRIQQQLEEIAGTDDLLSGIVIAMFTLYGNFVSQECLASQKD